MSEKPLTHEARRQRRREMAKLVDAGISYLEVARQFRVTETTVRQACKEYGLTKPRKVTLEEKIVSDLVRGDDPAIINARYQKATKNLITRIRKLHGISELRRPKSTRPSTLRIVADLIHGTESISEIARQYRISHQRVHQIKQQCVELAIPIHDRYQKISKNITDSKERKRG